VAYYLLCGLLPSFAFFQFLLADFTNKPRALSLRLTTSGANTTHHLQNGLTMLVKTKKININILIAKRGLEPLQPPPVCAFGCHVRLKCVLNIVLEHTGKQHAGVICTPLHCDTTCKDSMRDVVATQLPMRRNYPRTNFDHDPLHQKTTFYSNISQRNINYLSTRNLILVTTVGGTLKPESCLLQGRLR